MNTNVAYFLKFFSKLTVCIISFKTLSMWYQLGRPFLLQEPIYILNNIKILKKNVTNIGFKSQHMPRV